MAPGFCWQTGLTFPALNLILITKANNQVDYGSADSKESAVMDIM